MQPRIPQYDKRDQLLLTITTKLRAVLAYCLYGSSGVILTLKPHSTHLATILFHYSKDSYLLSKLLMSYFKKILKKNLTRSCLKVRGSYVTSAFNFVKSSSLTGLS